MRFNLDTEILPIPMVVGHNSTTAPVFATTETAASRAIRLQGFSEATFIMSIGANTATTINTSTPATFSLKFQECATNSATDGDWTDIPHDDLTTAARFFEAGVDSTTVAATAGTLKLDNTSPSVFAGVNNENLGFKGNRAFFATMLAEGRKSWIRAVPTNGVVAVPYSVLAILSVPRYSSKTARSEFRVAGEGGVGLVTT